MRKSLVEKAKIDLERLSTMPEKQKMIKESGILKLFEDFIAGSIPKSTFDKHFQNIAGAMLESL
jgi:hypothetical protein